MVNERGWSRKELSELNKLSDWVDKELRKSCANLRRMHTEVLVYMTRDYARYLAARGH